MSFSTKIYKRLDPCVGAFPRMDFSDRNQYAGALILSYQTMVASEPLLKICAAKEAELTPHLDYFHTHEQEERGHEKWMEKDLQALGFEVRRVAPFPEIIDMVGWQYYTCSHISHLSLLGYMAVIEGYPQPKEKVERLKELYPRASFTLAYHSENDVEHRANLIQELNQVPDEWQPLVMESAIRTAHLYRNALWRLNVSLKG